MQAAHDPDRGSAGSRDSSQRLYPLLLGPHWPALHPNLRDVHTRPGTVQSRARFAVWRRPGRLVGWLLDQGAVPAASPDVPVTLTIDAWDEPDGPHERWLRTFGGRPLVTDQSVTPGGLLAERIGPLEYRFRLLGDADSLVFVQESCRLRLGRLTMPLPRSLAPTIWCRASGTSTPGQTVVAVTASDPSGGVLFSYRGVVEWGEWGGRTP